MARRRQVVGRPRRQRVEWSGAKMDNFAVVLADTATSLGSSIQLLAAIDSMTAPTLVRMRGEILVVGATGTIGFSSLIGVGIGVASRRATTAGTTSLPRAIEEMDFSWLWHSLVMIRFSSGSTSEGTNVARVVIDSRAMRKISSNEEEVFYSIENDAGGGDVSVEVAIQTRVLLKES